MKTIDFVVREHAGDSSTGMISAGEPVTSVEVGGGREISLNLRQFDISGYARSGSNLEITLADGRIVVLQDYYADDGNPGSRLFVSADGYLNEVTLVEGNDGVLYAQYGPTSAWGKWTPSEELIFLSEAEVIAPEEEDEETVAMLGAGIFGGSGLLGAAGAGAAAVAASSVVAGDDGKATIQPEVTQKGDIVIGGDDAGPNETPIVISGQAQPGSTVNVTIGIEVVEATVQQDGTWEAVFEGAEFPADGQYVVDVVVINPAGNETQLSGPNVVIDLTPPQITVDGGQFGQGVFINAEVAAQGFEITGTGEAGTSIAVSVAGLTHQTVVDENGNWSIGFHPGELPEGDYQSTVTIIGTDPAGNTTTITRTLDVDTVAHPLEIATSSIEGDGVVNADEMADGLSITGQSEPGATVTIEIEGVSQSAVTDATGSWTAVFAPGDLPSGEYNTTVTATTVDLAGNSTTATGTLRIDTELRDFAVTSQPGGTDGVLNFTELDSGFILTGTVEPGSAVTVQMAGTTIPATVRADGSWSAGFREGQIPEGTYTATMLVTATDGAGNVRVISDTVNVDTDAGLLAINAGGIGGDGTVNADEAAQGVTISGVADEPGAIVTVSFGGVVRSAVVDASGNWETTYTASDIQSGVYDAEVTARLTDAAGNSTDVAASVHVDTRVDNLNLSDIDIATSADGTDLINNQVAADGFVVTGTVEPGSTVFVTLGDATRQAVVDDAGNWSVQFLPGDVAPGEYEATMTVDVTDPSGNASTLTDTVTVDTLVNELRISDEPVETDNVVNAAEAADGITLTGRVEPGSAVTVELLGKSYSATVDANGNWTLDVPAGDIPAQELNIDYIVNATDAAGNSSSVTQPLEIDLVPPDAPATVGYFREGGGYRSATLETTGDEVTIHQVDAAGGVAQLALHASEDAFLGETDYHFLDGSGAPTTIPDGSELIVTSADTAGNTSSSYVVLDGTDTSVVDLSNPNLAGFQIDSVDLRFGDQSEMTIDEAQLAALSDSTESLVVRGGADDAVTVAGGVAAGQTQVNGEQHDIYTLGDSGAAVIVEDDINVIT